MIGIFVVFSTGMAWFFESQATTTVIIARYVDPAALGGTDPGLSPAGRNRAEELARVLRDVDVVSGVDEIFVAPNRRSRDSVLSLAMYNDAPLHTIDDPDDEKALAKRILTEFKGDIVLVVTEPQHIRNLVRKLQGSKKVPEMADLEYDNLYIVTIPWFGKVKTLRLRYGAPYVPAPVPEA
jgi:broad specificity phosphatase PhoE